MQHTYPLLVFTHVEGECPGCLYLWSECERWPQPSVMETSVLDYASERQTPLEPSVVSPRNSDISGKPINKWQ